MADAILQVKLRFFRRIPYQCVQTLSRANPALTLTGHDRLDSAVQLQFG
jgi:hypothetical protein